MFPLQLLCPPLADDLLVGGQVAVIGTPAVGIIAANSKKLEQGFELQPRWDFTRDYFSPVNCFSTLPSGSQASWVGISFGYTFTLMKLVMEPRRIPNESKVDDDNNRPHTVL